MESFIQSLKNLGPGRLLIFGALAAGLLIFFGFFITKFATPGMDTLYGKLDASDSQRIVTQLETMGITYDLKEGGSQILIPEEDVSRVRLQLADMGLPGSGVIGYEIFDKSETLGATNFLQNVNYLRALEGELAKTIEFINNVKSARVHLVLPKRELFSREKQTPSASIFLNMKGSIRLNSEQVSSIQHLVAAAIPSLMPASISIIDNKGKLLAAGFEDTDPLGTSSVKVDERRRALEMRLSRTIEELVEKTVGFGKVRAEVNARMDFDRINSQEERYDPEGQVVGSTQTIEESASNKEAEGMAPVTVGTNLPDATSGSGDSANSVASENRTEEVVNFKNSKKITNHVREAGVVKQLSVAVLIDGIRVEAENGELTYKERPAAQMELLSTLVKGAIGYNADRGDVVEVINMEFAKFDVPETEKIIFLGLVKTDILRLAEILVMLIVALLVIMLVVRPLISRAFEASQSAADAARERLLEQATAAPALAGPGGALEGFDDDAFEELIDIDHIEGKVKSSAVKRVGEIIEKHPEAALSIVRGWMSD